LIVAMNIDLISAEALHKKEHHSLKQHKLEAYYHFSIIC
jgi:hypothetical protein